MHRPLIILVLAVAITACSSATAEPPKYPVWTLDEVSFFPPDRSLTHAEDGIVLNDGTLLVGDFEHGLLAISPDGSTRPFGDFRAAGFTPKPATGWNSPNGISLEPDGRHALVADITEGFIFRVDTRTGAVTRILDHTFGVNSAVRDDAGAIWFTQSTENASGPESESRMFAAADSPLGDGAVYRIAPEQVGLADPLVESKIEGLNFANGIAYDAGRSRMYVAELVANRILSFDIDTSSGRLSDRTVLADVTSPDNLELDEAGNLWVASPMGNEVLVVDSDSGTVQSVFQPTPVESSALAAEWRRRLQVGESTLDLLGPDTWGPMPGLLTGIILTPGGGPVYLGGLGDALVKLDR